MDRSCKNCIHCKACANADSEGHIPGEDYDIGETCDEYADKIYLAIEHVVHYDWENTRIVGASFNEAICEKIIEKAESEFHSFNDEYAEYWVDDIRITNDINA